MDGRLRGEYEAPGRFEFMCVELAFCSAWLRGVHIVRQNC